MPTRRLFTRCLATSLAWPGAWAWALDRPAGPVVLTVTGRVRMPNTGDRAVFDMAMLERLPQQSFVTHTPWYATPRKFTGPLLRDVLAAAGAQGSNLRAIALNDYRVDLPFDDVQRHDVLLARLLDDQPLAVRDKGPLFIIYPFDAKVELRTTVYYSRSAWQLKTIDVQ
ncbi:MAG: molybdopterin-dependent oxidoreductase [Rubrivivax sp.]